MAIESPRIFRITVTLQSTVVRVALVMALSTTLNLAHADGAAIALHGNAQGAPACATCHGAAGEGTAASGYPRLAGLGAEYLAAQLDAFANGQRNNPVMAAVARALTSDDRAAVALYYAALAAPTVKAGGGPGANSPGALLFDEGRWPQGLPACSQCHGPGGDGVGTTFPALTGQSALYLENQLHAWQKGARPPGPLALMSVVASKLSDSDIKDLASYISALPASPPFRKSKP